MEGGSVNPANISIDLQNKVGTFFGGNFTGFNNVTEVGLGAPAIYGADNRRNLTNADGSPVTMYTVPAGHQHVYIIAVHVIATAFTSGTATYTLTWTENGVAKTLAVSVSAGNNPQSSLGWVRADASTAITVQLTGTFTATIDVAGVAVELFQ